MNAKNWHLVYYLPTNAKAGYFQKISIVTSDSFTEGTPFFVNLCVMYFSQVEPKQNNFSF